MSVTSLNEFHEAYPNWSLAFVECAYKPLEGLLVLTPECPLVIVIAERVSPPFGLVIVSGADLDAVYTQLCLDMERYYGQEA